MTAPLFFVGMETSGMIRNALRARGVEAWSCDLLPSADNSPFHIIGNVFDYLDWKPWAGAIFHPDCTYLTVSAEWAYKDPDYVRYPGVGYHQKVKPETLVGAPRREARERALDDVRRLLGCKIPRITVENPRGVIGTRVMRESQMVHPNYFGDDASKQTCFWHKNWPNLPVDPAKRFPGRIVEWPRGSGKMVERWSNQTDSNQNKLTPSEDRWQKRSETFPGIAESVGARRGDLGGEGYRQGIDP